MAAPRNDIPCVLHFVGCAHDVGGTLSYIRALMPENGAHNVLIVQQGFEQTRRPFLKTLQIPPGDYDSLLTPDALLDNLRQLFRLRALLTRHPNLIFHAYSRGGVFLALLLNLLGHRRVVVMILFNGRHRWFYRFARRVLRDRIVYVCPAMKRYYGVSGAGWQHCIPGSVSPQWLGRTRPRATWTWRPGRPLVIGGCGLLVERKRWETVLLALGMLDEELRDQVRFIHIGENLDQAISIDYARRLRQLVTKHGLEAVVQWRGNLDEIDPFFAEIDLLVHPAHEEPYGMAVVESLFAGVPVIASDSTGAADLFAANENGLKFPGNKPEQLAALLTSILRGERPLPPVNRQSLRPLEPDYLSARWAEVYARILEEDRA